MKTIAIIDDDIYIGDMLSEVLTREGYHVLRAYSGTEALYLLKESRPDLILLDLMLPGLSGEEVLPAMQKLPAAKGIPVIVVSAKVEVTDKVKLLLGGAADYVTKPFDVKELLARITVQLRKTGQKPEIYIFDDLSLNTSSHEVLVGQRPVRLTRTEYAILKLLLSRPDQVFTRSVLLDHISEDTPDCTENSLKMHVSNLRKKLREEGGRDYVEAVWGIGFKMKGL